MMIFFGKTTDYKSVNYLNIFSLFLKKNNRFPCWEWNATGGQTKMKNTLANIMKPHNVDEDYGSQLVHGQNISNSFLFNI